MLTATELCFSYGKNEVIHNVNLKITDGIFAFIGLNGSGKSTLLRLLLGIIKPTSGTIELDGKLLEKWRLEERTKKVSLLESQSQIFFAMTVHELLEVSQRQNKENELIKKAIQSVGLEGYETRNLLELSSGELQRAFLAHTLISGAQTILLDEPFSHLDWNHQIELAQSLRTWRKEYGTTFIIALHELERAVQLADQIGLMHKGRLRKVGTPEEIFSSAEIRESFAFKATIDENPIDRSKRLTLGK